MKIIIDVSSVVYAGHYARPNLRFQGFPIGGIYNLLRMINSDIHRADFVLCFDGGDIIKKELLPTYKAGRIPDYSVLAQIDVLKEILLGCDIPFYHDPKYEADDFVYSVCRTLDEMNDLDTIKIVSDDRDLACNVRENCTLNPASTNGCCIDYRNFSDRVVKDRDIPYNTLLLWKIFKGDSSDHYKGVKVPGLDFDSMANHFVEVLSPLIGQAGFTDMAYADYAVFEAFLEEYTGTLSPSDIDMLKEQARIVYPYQLNTFTTSREDFIEALKREIPAHIAARDHMKVFGNGNFDARRFDFIVSMLGPRNGYKRKYRGYNEDGAEGEEVRQYFSLKAKDLASGAMAVERYRSKKTVRPQTETLQNMELPI